MKQKSLVLLSNGLDSRLAVKIMQGHGDVIGFFVKLPFSKDVEKEIHDFCKEQSVKLKIVDCTKGKLLQEYLGVVRNPKFGRGLL